MSGSLAASLGRRGGGFIFGRSGVLGHTSQTRAGSTSNVSAGSTLTVRDSDPRG